MIHFGCNYYPEQWAQWLDEGEARWKIDAEMMAEAGFNTVRLAEFAWAMFEEEADDYRFDWLDRAIDILHQQGLSIVLGTPTPVPPPWLLSTYPDLTQIDANGRRQGPGTRREACANHPSYQNRSRLIVEHMAQHYAKHSAVIGWQTDNEFGCNDSARCYCDYCKQAFRTWVENRYGDIDCLNRAWGGAFWGEIYQNWSQIPLPSRSRARRNPGHILDFYRFSSDTWRNYQKQQIDILRHTCPDHFVTHNMMGFSPHLNYFDLGEHLDFVSWDNYHHHGSTPASVAAAHDHMWGIRKRNFWVMEQQVGQLSWDAFNPLPPPNFVRLKTYQSLAHGADGILYFRWRQALAGAEQYACGLLDHAGRSTRGYEEAKKIGNELHKLSPILQNTQPRSQVAILLDYDSRWAMELQPHNPYLTYSVSQEHTLASPALYMDDFDVEEGPFMTGATFRAWPYLAPFVALWEKNISVAIISPDSDLSDYALVCAPFLHMLTPGIVDHLKNYVESGGTLVTGPRSGVKDEHNRLMPEPQPGPLTHLVGAHVREIDSLEPDRINNLYWHDIHTIHDTQVALWAEILEPVDAEILASYSHDWYARTAAITLKRHDAGQVIYVGCMGGPILYKTLFDWLLPTIDVHSPMPSVAGVEVCARHAKDGRRILFLLNHTEHRHTLSLTHPITDLLTDVKHENLLILEPSDVIVFEG